MPKKLRWTEEEFAHVLAMVDHCKEVGNFEEAIEPYLAEKGYVDRGYPAIATKLYKYKVMVNEALDQPHMEVLLQQGTEILPKLKENPFLARRVEEIKAELAAPGLPAAPVAQSEHGDLEGPDGLDEADEVDEVDEVEEVEELSDGRVEEGLTLLYVKIKEVCNSLIIHGDFQAGPEKPQLLAKIPFHSVWSAWNASKLDDSQEQFLRSLVTAHIFRCVLASAFPAGHLGLDAPYVKMLFAVDLQQGLLQAWKFIK
ncbi:hypothetical protein PG997_007552 [Apiospora hydei]|uniref:CTLH domain-containing protein n=1 Tax=Apiospora hydei TaxID=1337664 RepID=A0ABR1W8C9_9PEZI